MIPYNQLSLADIFADCQNKFEDDKPAFLALLESCIDLDEIVSATFHTHESAPADLSPLLKTPVPIWKTKITPLMQMGSHAVHMIHNFP